MKVPLLGSILPPCGSVERNDLDEKTKILITAKQSDRQKRCTQNNKLTSLLLKVTDECLSAICGGKNKQLDALVKNFGCQITALQVSQALQSAELLEEAESLKEPVKNCLSKPLSTTLPKSSLSLADYLQDRSSGLEASPELVQLVRFRMLCIVNCNRVSRGREEPYSNLDLLVNKIAKIDANLVERLVSGIQAEESLKAAKYIKRQARLVAANGALLERVVSKNFRRVTRSYITTRGKQYTPITSVPLLFNTEIVIRRIAGTILIKNKLQLAGVPIAGAEELKIYLQMPEEKILDKDEAALLEAKKPLIVIEGYVKNAGELRKAIARVGVLAIVNANSSASHVVQYASGTNQDPISDEEARDYLKQSSQQQIVDAIFEVDHIYCSTPGEENEIAT